MVIEIPPELSRSTLERLLLAPGEDDAWDFKEALDISTTRGKVTLSKHVMAFSNTPGGGHLVLGVTDSREPVGLPPGIELDVTKLYQACEKYIDGDFAVRVAAHQIERSDWPDARRFGLIYVPRTPGLAVVAACAGNAAGADGKTNVLFREGDILVRRGGKSTRANATDLRQLFRNAAFHQEIATAIAALWQGVLDLQEVAGGVLTLYDILTEEELASVYENPRTRAYLDSVGGHRYMGEIDRVGRSVESHRPFLSDRMWQLFFVYRAIVGRILHKAAEGQATRAFPAWNKDLDGATDDNTVQLARLLLTEPEFEYCLTGGSGVPLPFGTPRRVLQILEGKVLGEARDIIRGKK